MNNLYYFALAYLTIMAVTGLYLRNVLPEEVANNQHYVMCLVLLSALWPATWITVLTIKEDEF